jgi:glycosyltransferase involved in cell wall biosynthesis
VRPPVSICLTTYNRSSVLSSTLDSLLAQDFGDFELIISDDHSSDDTDEVCRQYQRRDRRVSYYRNATNLGMPGNLNAAISHSQGEYVANLHDGDVYRAELLRKWKDALNEAPDSPFVFNAYDCIRANGEHWIWRIPFSSGVIEENFIARDFFRRLVSCVFGTVMARRSAYEHHGLFDTSFGFISDVEMWLRLSHGRQIAYVAEPLITIMEREGNKPYYGWPWQQMFWTIAIYSKMLELYRDVIPKEIEQYSHGFRFMVCRHALYNMALLIKHRRWRQVQDGLRIWKDAPVTPLSMIGRFLRTGHSSPSWYTPALWHPLARCSIPT